MAFFFSQYSDFSIEVSFSLKNGLAYLSKQIYNNTKVNKEPLSV